MDFFSASPNKLSPVDTPLPAPAASDGQVANSAASRPALARQRVSSAQASASTAGRPPKPVQKQQPPSSVLRSPFHQSRVHALSIAAQRGPAPANAPNVGRKARTRSLQSRRVQPYPSAMSSERGGASRSPLQPVKNMSRSTASHVPAMFFSSPLAASTPKGAPTRDVVEASAMNIDTTLSAFNALQINPSASAPIVDGMEPQQTHSSAPKGQTTTSHKVTQTYSKHAKSKRSAQTSEGSDLHEIFSNLDLDDKQKWTATADPPPKPLGEIAAKVKSKDRLLKGISKVEAKSKAVAQKRLKSSVLGTPAATSTPKPKYSRKENRMREPGQAQTPVGSRRYAVKSIQGAFVRMRIEENVPQSKDDSDDEIAAW